jgi:HEAT repeat protein
MIHLVKMLLGVAVLACASAPAVAQPRLFKKTAAQWTAQLQDQSAAERRNAAFALGKFGAGANGAMPALKQLYAKETDARTREAIVLAAGEIASETGSVDVQLESMLIDALQRDKDRLVRRSAAVALGMLGSRKQAVVTALGQALSDPEQVVRQNAAWALGRADAQVAADLIRALKDDSCDSLVKRDAANALFAVTKGDPSVMRPALDALLAMCQDKSVEVRKSALMALNKIVGPKDERAVAILRTALDDTDSEVRRFAALALSNVGGKAAVDAVPVLIDTLRNGQSEHKRAAAIGIRNVGEPAVRAIPDLIRALQDPDDDLRKYAAMALAGIGKAGGPAVPALVNVVADTGAKSDVRVQASEALAYMRDLPEIRKELPRLLKILDNSREDGGVRVRVVWVVQSFELDRSAIESAKPVMERLCAEPGSINNGDARYQCAYDLSAWFKKQVPDSVINVLQEWLFDPSGRNYEGTQAKAGASGTERKDEGQSKQILTGDSRTSAVKALGVVGLDRVRDRRQIVEQLRRLENDAKTDPVLRKAVRELNQKLGV